MRMAPRPTGSLWGAHGNKGVMDLKWRAGWEGEAVDHGGSAGWMASAGADRTVQVSHGLRIGEQWLISDLGYVSNVGSTPYTYAHTTHFSPDPKSVMATVATYRIGHCANVSIHRIGRY